MKDPSLQPKVHKAVSPGLLCPNCRSSNTYYSCKNQMWYCLNCLELFDQKHAYKPPPSTPTKVYKKVQSGTWYYKSGGLDVFFISDEYEQERADRLAHPEKYYPPGYETWKVKWDEICKRIEERAWLESLTPEQINQIKEELNAQ